MPTYSVVVPMYNEQEVIEETYKRISNVLKDESYEIILVDDGSIDNTALIAHEICKKDKHIKLVSFSRNFGHQVAISAGIDYARGDAVIIIDADLQDPPEVILDMIKMWKSGYDVVYGKRIKRKGETWFKKQSAKLFYRILSKMANIEIPVDAGDFRLMDKKVCNQLRRLGEKNRYMRGLVSWVGFRQGAVEYERDERFAGKTKYPLSKMVQFALDGILSFSRNPLRFATYIGLFLAVMSFLYLIFIVLQRIFGFLPTQLGWTSIVAVSLFFNGIILIFLGLIGEYIGRIYDECKNRPLYIVKEEVGFDEND